MHAIEGDYLSHKDKHGYFDIFNKFEDTFLAKFAQHGPYDDWEVVKRGMKYNPDHVSTKELFHYGKLVQQGNFVEWTECDTFSHAVKNLWESTFGSGEKIIPLDNITKMPVGLFRAEDDYPGSDKDIDWLTTQLGNVVYNHVYPEMGHMSFVFGRNMSYVDNLVNLVK